MKKVIQRYSYTFSVFFLLFIHAKITAQQVKPQGHITKAEIETILKQCEALKANGRDYKDNNALYILAKTTLYKIDPSDAENRSRLYAYLGYGYYLFMNDSKIDSMQFAYEQSLREAQKANQASLIAQASISLMHLSYELRQTDKAAIYKNILETIIDTTTDKSILREGDAALADFYGNKSYYSTAQDYYLKTIKLSKQQADTAKNPIIKKTLAGRYYMLGQLYLKTDEPEEAINTFFNGLNNFRNQTDLTYHFYTALITAYCKKGNIDSALLYLHQYIDPLEARFKNNMGAPFDVVFSNMAIAKYYTDQKQYNKAAPYINKTVELVNSKPYTDPDFMYAVQKMNGRYLLETKNYQSANDTLIRALPVAKEMNREDEADILKYLAMSQRGLNNYPASLRYYEEYTALLDSLTKEKVSRNFADVQTHYQTNEKESRIVVLNQQNKLNTLELKEASNTRDLLILSLISVGLFSLLLYFIYRNKEKLNKILNQRNTQLDQLNGELSVANDTKAKLFGVISHDLRAPVSKIVNLLHLHRENSQNADEHVRNQYVERINKASENVLETMEDLLLWSKSQMEHFSPNLRDIQIEPLLMKETAFFDEQIKEKDLEIIIKCDENLMKKTDENFLTVILRNLLQNAISQSVKKSQISITADKQTISISNPIGKLSADELNTLLQKKQVSSSQSGLGLQLVKDLAKRIRINIFFDQKEEGIVQANLSWV